MSNPTTPFSWQMPTATDLVTDLPADFEVFGQAVATSMADLLGGSSGYILSKASATDMDFTWIANDQGDITGVTAGNGISVTNPTGPVPTVEINTAVTADLTTAQTLTNKKLSDSTTTIVDVSDATKAIKFDVAGTTAVTGTIATAFTTAKTVTIPDTTGTVALTNGVVNNTLTTTTGDTIYASAANTPARLGIGTTGQVLTVAGGIPSWATSATALVGVGAVQTSGSLAVVGNTVYAVPLGSTDQWDTDNFHSTTVNNSRITIPSGKAGKYLVTAAISPSSTANYAFLYYLVNGAVTNVPTGSPGGLLTRIQGNAGNSYGLYSSIVVALSVGDYIEMGFFSDATATITYDARFTATLLGA